MRVLLVEDQEKLVRSLKKGLELEGYAVDAIMDGEEAYQHALLNYEDYDIFIFDIMLPRKDGVSICRDLRERKISVPTIFLTAKNTTDEIIFGLNEGADDYLTKPFNFDELLARMRTLLRRPHAMLPVELEARGIHLNTSTHVVLKDGDPVNLTLKEFALLEYFMRNPNQVLNREQILSRLWDVSFESFSNVVDVHVKNLRRKLNDQRGTILETVYGVGYRFKG